MGKLVYCDRCLVAPTKGCVEVSGRIYPGSHKNISELLDDVFGIKNDNNYVEFNFCPKCLEDLVKSKKRVTSKIKDALY